MIFFQPFSDTANVYKLTRHSCQSNLFLALTGYGIDIICVTNSGKVARLMPNSIHISSFSFLSFPYLPSIEEFGFGQCLRHLPLRWIDWAISDRMPCAYRCYITSKCGRLLTSPIYTCKRSQDSVKANRIYAGQTENMRRLIFVFPLDTFSCDADHKFWQPNLNLVLNVSPHSTQLMLIIGNCAVVKVFNLISLYWRFHAIWSSDIHYYQRMV